MKIICPLLITILFALSSTAQDTNQEVLVFEKGSWKKALTKAKQENKLVFLDAYTKWCRPCKKMDREVFSNPKVAAFFNESFINYKMNMEDSNGIPVAIQYNIKSYPSFLFLDGDGVVHHRIAGYQPVPDFLEIGRVANDDKHNLRAMQQAYENGAREPDFLYQYTKTRFEAADNSHYPIAQTYLTTQQDLTTPDNLNFIFSFLDDADTEMFDLLIEHRADFERQFGAAKVAGKVERLIYDKLNDTVNRASLEQVDQLFLRAYPSRADEMSTRFRLTHYSQSANGTKYINCARYFMKNYQPKDADELNEIAWNVYELATERRDLKWGAKCALLAVAMDDSMYTNDTLAALYYRLGKRGKAIKTAERAILLARTNGEDYRDTQRLLDEIRASK